MKRFYNYNTGRLYESDGTFSITITGKALSDDVVLDTDDFGGQCGDKFFAYEEAKDYIKNVLIDNLCDAEGLDDGDYDEIETENGYTVIVPGYKQWDFVISSDLDEDLFESFGKLRAIKPKSRKKNEMNESVSERFSKLRGLFEEEGLEEDDKEDDKKDDDKDSDNADDNDSADINDNGDNDDDNDKDEENDEDEEMRAVVITVKKGDEDKCKEEMIDAGISEDDIDILEGEDDDENVEIRVDVNSVMELKDYLEKKGIDLEEEIGGEIVDDSEDGEEDDDKKNDKDSDEEGEGDDDFDFDNLGDLFGAGDEEEDEK